MISHARRSVSAAIEKNMLYSSTKMKDKCANADCGATTSMRVFKKGIFIVF